MRLLLLFLAMAAFPFLLMAGEPPKVSPTENLIATHREVPFICPKPERIFQPAGVAVTGDGGLFLLDARTGLVKSFSSEGRCINEFQGTEATGESERYWINALIRGDQESLILFNDEDGTISKFTTEGELIAQFAVDSGAKKSYKSNPVAADKKGCVYVGVKGAISEAPAVRKYDPDGTLLWERELAKDGKKLTEGDIGALAVDNKGIIHIWINGLESSEEQDWRCALLAYDGEGKYLFEKARGETQGLSGDINAAAIDAAGNRYELWFETVAGWGTTLVKFSPEGKRLWDYHWTAIEGRGIDVGPDGRVGVVFCDYKFTAPVCVVLSAEGEPVRAVGSNGTGAGELRDPSGLALDDENNLYVGDYYIFRIQKFNSAGSYLKKITGPDASVPEYTEINFSGQDYISPSSLSIDQDDCIFITYNSDVSPLGQSIARLNPDSGEIKKFDGVALGYGGYTLLHFGSAPQFPAAAATDSKGDIWAAIVREPEWAEGANGKEGGLIDQGIRVFKFDSKGKKLLEFGRYGSGPREFGQPQTGNSIGAAMLTVDMEDNVWVADPANNRVQKFDTTGGYLLEAGGHGRTPLNGPWGVAVDARGCLYVGDINCISVYNLKGERICVAAYLSEGEEAYSERRFADRYRGLKVDKKGNIYLSDASSGSIRKFVPSE